MKTKLYKFNQMDQLQKNYVVNFIKENYNAPDILLPSVEELEKQHLDMVMVSEPFDFAEAGNVGEIVLGITFLKNITETLMETRTTVVRKDKRGQGVATMLNVFVEDIAKKKGINKISCHIYAENLTSLFIKLKRGYLIEGLLRDHDTKGQHEYFVSKTL